MKILKAIIGFFLNFFINLIKILFTLILDTILPWRTESFMRGEQLGKNLRKASKEGKSHHLYASSEYRDMKKMEAINEIKEHLDKKDNS